CSRRQAASSPSASIHAKVGRESNARNLSRAPQREHPLSFDVAPVVKRVVPLLLVACATPSAPVTVAAPPSAPHAALRGTLLGGCTIEGDGERTRTRRNEYDQDIPFDLFPTRDASEPVLALADPAHAHVIWSHFPLPASDARFPRAEVELRGLGIRYRGWANLYGRTFTATRRLDAERGHVWAHAG